jgi:hypothetical protein
MDVHRVKRCDPDLFARFYLRFNQSGTTLLSLLTLNRGKRLGQSSEKFSPRCAI